MTEVATEGSSGPGVRMDDGRLEVSEARKSVNAEVDNNSENVVLPVGGHDVGQS